MATLDVGKLRPGDVIAVRLGNKWAHRLVWLFTAITTRSIKYAHYGHIAVYWGQDEVGRHWVIEAAPDGIGWRMIDPWDGKFGLTNYEQPKSDEQRTKIVELLVELTKARYDYSAYFYFALESVGITSHWIREYDGVALPPSFVCSALADFIYEVCQLANPGGDEKTRFTTPAEWARFADRREWEQ